MKHTNMTTSSDRVRAEQSALDKSTQNISTCKQLMAIVAIITLSLSLSYQLNASSREEHRPAPQDPDELSLSSEPRINQSIRAVSASLARDTANQTPGPFLGAGFVPDFFSDLSIHEARQLVHGATTDVPFNCSTQVRVGHVGDGGYQVCIQEPFNPKLNDCLVYSFGINNDWSFDEGMNNQYGCEVHSFDPSMKVDDHMHKDNISFHNLGIWGSNLKNMFGWELKDLKTIVNELKHTSRVIDYLKADVEGAEWPLMEHIIQSGIHSQIKQIAIEIHTPRLKSDVMTVNDYAEVFSGLHGLKNVGFQKYLFRTRNNCCCCFAVITTEDIAGKPLCCYEIFFVNSNFVTAY